MTTRTVDIATAVQSVGKQQNRDGWILTLTYNWPGSKYPATFYGTDWAQVQGIGVGDHVVLKVEQGSLKQGKDASKDYNYFWNLKSITKADGGAHAEGHSPTGPTKEALSQPNFTNSNGATDYDLKTRVSIERQKALDIAERSAACMFRAWTDYHSEAIGATDAPTFYEGHREKYGDLVRYFFGRYHAGISGHAAKPEQVP